MPTSARTWHHRIMIWPAHRTIKRCTLGHRSYAAPSFMAFPVLPHTPCRGRCPHRPAHRTIEFPYRLVRIRPGIPGIVTPYRRDDVGIVPYEHVRTADVTRRAGPVCPAVGTHRKPSDRPIDSDRVGRGLAPAAAMPRSKYFSQNIYRGWYPNGYHPLFFPLKEGRVPQSVKSS